MTISTIQWRWQNIKLLIIKQSLADHFWVFFLSTAGVEISVGVEVCAGGRWPCAEDDPLFITLFASRLLIQQCWKMAVCRRTDITHWAKALFFGRPARCPQTCTCFIPQPHQFAGDLAQLLPTAVHDNCLWLDTGDRKQIWYFSQLKAIFCDNFSGILLVFS